MQTQAKKRSYVAIGLLILGMLLCVMTIVGAVKFGTIFFLFPIWRWMAHKMTDATGMDIWLTRGISALLVIPFVYIVSLVFSWNKNKRHAGIAILAATTVLVCFGMFHISKDIYFSFKTGEAKKYYIITPQGEYKFNSSPGYDPLWGKKYEKVTREVIEKYIKSPSRHLLSEERFLTEEEEEVLVEKLRSLSLSEREKILNIVEILKISLFDYSEEICEVLERSHNRYKGIHTIGHKWRGGIDDKELISALVEIGSIKAIPLLLVIYVDSDSGPLRAVAKVAIRDIKKKNGLL